MYGWIAALRIAIMLSFGLMPAILNSALTNAKCPSLCGQHKPGRFICSSRSAHSYGWHMREITSAVSSAIAPGQANLLSDYAMLVT